MGGTTRVRGQPVIRLQGSATGHQRPEFQRLPRPPHSHHVQIGGEDAVGPPEQPEAGHDQPVLERGRLLHRLARARGQAGRLHVRQRDRERAVPGEMS